MLTYDIRFPHRVFSGIGSILRIPEILEQTSAKNICVVTDQSIVTLGLYEKVREAVGKECSLVGNVPAEPTLDELLSVYREVKAFAPDCLIGVGGGSVLDVCKLIAVMLSNEEFAQSPRDMSSISAPAVPMIAIPTTSGTGAEATANAIVLIPEEELKVGIIHDYLIPRFVILDPQMTMSLPRSLTATTGVDALCHAIESYWSKKNNPLNETFAFAAIELLTRSIERAYQNGGDMQAREDMQLGAFYAGVCLTSSSTTAIHALSYPLGGTFHVPHGLANAVLLPFVMRKNFPAVKSHLQRIAPFFQMKEPEEVVDAVFALMKRLNIPDSLHQVGVREEHLDSLVSGAVKVQRLLSQNPLELSEKDIRALYMELL